MQPVARFLLCHVSSFSQVFFFSHVLGAKWVLFINVTSGTLMRWVKSISSSDTFGLICVLPQTLWVDSFKTLTDLLFIDVDSFLPQGCCSHAQCLKAGKRQSMHREIDFSLFHAYPCLVRHLIMSNLNPFLSFIFTFLLKITIFHSSFSPQFITRFSSTTQCHYFISVAATLLL